MERYAFSAQRVHDIHLQRVLHAGLYNDITSQLVLHVVIEKDMHFQMVLHLVIEKDMHFQLVSVERHSFSADFAYVVL